MDELYLVLENGRTFKGGGFGAGFEEDIVGRAGFTTGMTGYMETLTDKRNYGMIIAQTFPLIGNYGVIPADFDGEPAVPRAYIVKQWCQAPSNYRSEGTLDTFLKQQGVVGLCGIDTRSLTREIRDNGAMNACITANPEAVDMSMLKAWRVENAAEAVSVRQPGLVKCPGGDGRTVAVLDYGCRRDTVTRTLHRYGCDAVILPCGFGLEQIMEYKPDGVVATGGPGNPADYNDAVQTLKALQEKKGVPVFGIGLGHQLLAIANGLKTAGLGNGHRGSNQPVRCTDSGRVYITSQNHGYVVEAESLEPDIGRVSFINTNDGSCEGIEYTGKRSISVQFYPETGGGPQDMSFVWERFMSFIGGREKTRAER